MKAATVKSFFSLFLAIRRQIKLNTIWTGLDTKSGHSLPTMFANVCVCVEENMANFEQLLSTVLT